MRPAGPGGREKQGWVDGGVRGSPGRGAWWVGELSKKGGGLSTSGRWRTGPRPPLPGARGGERREQPDGLVY